MDDAAAAVGVVGTAIGVAVAGASDCVLGALFVVAAIGEFSSVFLISRSHSTVSVRLL